MSLIQEQLIVRVKQKCRDDNRLVAALTYGSFTKGEGDQYSDIEFWLFFESLDGLDTEAWIGDISPVHYITVNEFETHVAFFKEHLIRGEFHFKAASEMETVRLWPAIGPPASDQMVIVDRTGKLHAYIGEGKPSAAHSVHAIERLCGQYLNWLLFGFNVLKRGDLAQAHMILGKVQGYLLWMVRLKEESTNHWLTQSKSLEREISRDAYQNYVECTARCENEDLVRAYRHSWIWGSRLITDLERRHGFSIPTVLLEAIAGYVHFAR
jgi:lincosamide nucleotidyltransferase B/F